MVINISCSQNWAFFGNKAVKKWEGDGISKIPSTVLETRYWWAIVPSLGAFQLSVLEINSWEGTKNIVWEMVKFLNNFVLKINATMQLSCTFLPTLGRNFFTQFSRVDPFQNELYEETIKARGWCQPPWLGFGESWQATSQKSTSMTRRQYSYQLQKVLRLCHGQPGEEKALRLGENALACRAALGLKKFARADHHDIQEKRRLGNADADSTRGHGQMLLSSAGLRGQQMS